MCRRERQITTRSSEVVQKRDDAKSKTECLKFPENFHAGLYAIVIHFKLTINFLSDDNHRRFSFVNDCNNDMRRQLESTPGFFPLPMFLLYLYTRISALLW